jgi:hypothetical protein
MKILKCSKGLLMANMIDIIYRLSDNGYSKEKFLFATKEFCLLNILQYTYHPFRFNLLVDTTNLKPETKIMVERYAKKYDFSHRLHYVTAGSSAGSWRIAWDFAMANCKNRVYFVEDDYLHREDYHIVMQEGLDIADYVSLYDHNDKYIPASKGGNQFIDDDGGEETKVYRTTSVHWKLTNSTTMTFATEEIWKKWTLGTHPHDFQAFLELRAKGRSLITPIPGYSTHCEPKWAAPGINWSDI